MPHIGASTSLSLCRAVSTRPRSGAAYAGVLEEHLVKVSEAVEEERVARLPLESPVLLEHGRRAHVEPGMLASRDVADAHPFARHGLPVSVAGRRDGDAPRNVPSPCRRTRPRACRSPTASLLDGMHLTVRDLDRVAVDLGARLLHGTSRGSRVRARSRPRARHSARPRPDVRRRSRGRAGAPERRLRPRRRPRRRARGLAARRAPSARTAVRAPGRKRRPRRPRAGATVLDLGLLRPAPRVRRRARRCAGRVGRRAPVVYGRPSAAEEKQAGPPRG